MIPPKAYTALWVTVSLASSQPNYHRGCASFVAQAPSSALELSGHQQTQPARSTRSAWSALAHRRRAGNRAALYRLAQRWEGDPRGVLQHQAFRASRTAGSEVDQPRGKHQKKIAPMSSRGLRFPFATFQKTRRQRLRSTPQSQFPVPAAHGV